MSNSKLMKVFIGGSDSYDGVPLYKAIVSYCQDEAIAGATVQRCIYGYGRDTVIRSSRTLALSEDLPIIIEVIDSEENLRRIMPKIKEMTGGSLVTMQDIEIFRYESE